MGVDGEAARGGAWVFRRIYRGRLCAHNEVNLGTIHRAGNRLLEKDRAEVRGEEDWNVIRQASHTLRK
jgi:hypothetical protein